MALLSTPPGLPSLMDGFLNLRGVLVPVVRMQRLFDFPPVQLNLQTPLLIVRIRQDSIDPQREASVSPAGATLLGLCVDHVREIISAELCAPYTIAPGSMFNDCAVAQLGFGDLAIHVLSTERLLIEQERQTITHLQAEMQARLNALPQYCP